MTQSGFRILPRVHTDHALLRLFDGLPTAIVSDNMNRMTGTWGLVNPGDIVVGDDDGLVFIAPQDAKTVAEASRNKARAEAATLDSIAAGSYDDQWIDQTLKTKGVL